MAHVYAHSSFPSGGGGSKDEQEKIYNFLYRNTFSGLTMQLSSYTGLASVLDYMEQNIGNSKHDITVLFPMQANGTEMTSIYAAYPTRSTVYTEPKVHSVNLARYAKTKPYTTSMIIEVNGMWTSSNGNYNYPSGHVLFYDASTKTLTLLRSGGAERGISHYASYYITGSNMNSVWGYAGNTEMSGHIGPIVSGHQANGFYGTNPFTVNGTKLKTATVANAKAEGSLTRENLYDNYIILPISGSGLRHDHGYTKGDDSWIMTRMAVDRYLAVPKNNPITTDGTLKFYEFFITQTDYNSVPSSSVKSRSTYSFDGHASMSWATESQSVPVNIMLLPKVDPSHLTTPTVAKAASPRSVMSLMSIETPTIETDKIFVGSVPIRDMTSLTSKKIEDIMYDYFGGIDDVLRVTDDVFQKLDASFTEVVNSAIKYYDCEDDIDKQLAVMPARPYFISNAVTDRLYAIYADATGTKYKIVQYNGERYITSTFIQSK